MKYEIYNPQTSSVLGWAMTLNSARERAAFFIDRNPLIHIRNKKTKKVEGIVKKEPTQDKVNSLPT
jgi:hypothetical protein